MSRKRRVFSGSLKAKVALAAPPDKKTLGELASRFEVHANEVAAWKKQAIEGISKVSPVNPRSRG